MNPSWWLALSALSITAFCALGAKSLRSFSRRELAEICRRRKAEGRLADILLHHERVALAIESLQLIATAVFIGGAITAMWTDRGEIPHTGQLLLWGTIGGLILLLVVLWLPVTFARLWAEPFLFATWRIWQAVAVPIAPLVIGARMIDVLGHRLVGKEPSIDTEETIENEIRSIVDEGHREGLIEEDAREMIEGIIELGDADVAHVMTPRTDLVTMSAAADLPTALQMIIDSGHTRIPVFDKNRDDIVGIIYAKDLLPELAKPPEARINQVKKIIREAYFVPETKPVDALLNEFQLTGNHMAVVLDEYGGVSGVVTIEDVLEEIVGEIVDEYDEALVEGIRKIDDHSANVLARVHVDEINDRLGTNIDEDGDFDTIGGYVFSTLGRVPGIGDMVEADNGNVRISVVEVSKRRIEKVKIEILGQVERPRA